MILGIALIVQRKAKAGRNTKDKKGRIEMQVIKLRRPTWREKLWWVAPVALFGGYELFVLWWM